MSNKRKSALFLLILCLLPLNLSSTKLHASCDYISGILEPKNDESELFKAIREKNIDEIKKLIANDANLNNKNTYGYTSLMAAAYSGDVSILEVLIENGAKINSYDNSGNNALMYTLYGTKEKTDALKFLISKGSKIEILNNQNQSPLILAALNGRSESIKLLIENGAKIEKKGSLGCTALMHAIDNQRLNSISTLIEFGADIETRDDLSFTPIILAAFRNDSMLIEKLIEAGAKVDAKTTMKSEIEVKKDWLDFHPKKVTVPKGSTALDVARIFQKNAAINTLSEI
jgi:ankyrin repeat protein